MQSKGNAPTAGQKRWRELVRSLGCINHPGTPAEIHHVVGCTGKHNKVAIGHWFVLPLCHWCHRDDPDCCVDLWPARFTDLWGDQRTLFWFVIDELMKRGNELPFGEDVYQAIMDTRK